ncbi:MAG: MTAP family purine nucleoside phosphorylase [Thaumarchaeota archaeon]|nr:MTAP family purine nucleoside phosphorylase [Nitrososphaerota archaeon]
MTRNSRFGVITGTGVTEHFGVSVPEKVETKYGSAQVYRSGEGGYYFLPRHGPGHTVPPHMINYRANLAALEKLGVRKVIATSAVGSMKPGFGVGRIGLVDQFLDFTKRRNETFFSEEVTHTDMTNPYSSGLNRALGRAGDDFGVRLSRGLVYVCAEGPRFETAAEIRMYRKLGGDVVGMTGVPEVVLANEKDMEYASVVIATNWAAGIQKKVSHEEVVKVMKKTGMVVKELIDATIKRLESGGSD